MLAVPMTVDLSDYEIHVLTHELRGALGRMEERQRTNNPKWVDAVRRVYDLLMSSVHAASAIAQSQADFLESREASERA
jgi:hypothetical protein